MTTHLGKELSVPEDSSVDQLNEREVEGLEEGDAGDRVYMTGKGSQKPLQFPSTFLCCSMLTDKETQDPLAVSLFIMT